MLLSLLCALSFLAAVLLLSFVYPGAPAAGEAERVDRVMNTVELGLAYFGILPHEIGNVALALLPIVVFFLIFQVAALRLRRVPFLRILMGDNALLG